MSIRLYPEHLTYDDVRSAADDLLCRIPQRAGPPLQVEEIVDLDLGIEIVPLPSLMERYGIDGFTASDFSRIYIDQRVYDQDNENRYRFTLAHELGHLILHKNILHRFAFQNIDGYKDFVQNVDEDDREWLEHQANWFAGLILIPAIPLRQTFDAELASSRLQQALATAKDSNLPRDTYLEHIVERIAQGVGRRFAVSSQVAVKRIQRDELAERIP